MCNVCETDFLPIESYLNMEKKELDSYCRDNGLYYRLNSEKSTLDVISKSGEWKIVVDGDENLIRLYHRNHHWTKERSLILGYHRQYISSDTLMGYMKYIVNHDMYREENPLYKHLVDSKTVKGSKRWKKNQQKAERVRKSRRIRYVNAILDSISLGNDGY